MSSTNSGLSSLKTLYSKSTWPYLYSLVPQLLPFAHYTQIQFSGPICHDSVKNTALYWRGENVSVDADSPKASTHSLMARLEPSVGWKMEGPTAGLNWSNSKDEAANPNAPITQSDEDVLEEIYDKCVMQNSVSLTTPNQEELQTLTVPQSPSATLSSTEKLTPSCDSFAETSRYCPLKSQYPKCRQCDSYQQASRVVRIMTRYDNIRNGGRIYYLCLNHEPGFIVFEDEWILNKSVPWGRGTGHGYRWYNLVEIHPGLSEALEETKDRFFKVPSCKLTEH
ncbi:hypothetical protein HYALB_00011884 [Hymenoscyphus albidus]|uniref:Uncharacterized protein n=1 Tax=Hymenoscyphus albidus TaxID=595503 RepID=A0A9N9PZP1_9HELO|nr:hypothetical protein HYALB_00011884 [Hymenoscyphus albidus]